jgi:GntR family transcriptional regulator / MocR family aminotransferase
MGWLPAGLDQVALVRQASVNDLTLVPVSIYSLEPLARQGLVLGYAAYSVPEIQDAVRRLAAVMRAVYHPSRRRS